jgi:hypothetical protein
LDRGGRSGFVQPSGVSERTIRFATPDSRIEDKSPDTITISFVFFVFFVFPGW